MPKSQFIDPSEVRKAGSISFDEIPCNRYAKTLAEERNNFSDGDFLHLYHDMVYIRKMEQMLLDIKENSRHKATSYDYPGPSHLCLGQEAAVVGQAFCLSPEDMIFGTHRNHGDVLAKGLSAIRQIEEKELSEIMETCNGGKTLKAIEKASAGKDLRKTAELFLAYGLTAEIFGKETGFNKGLGGSMHVFFPPFGSYPNNAIVGGSATIGAGAGLYKKINRQNGIVSVNIGDGALGRGPVWEAMVFSAMEQYSTLWDEEFKGGLPVLFTVFNNFYGMGGQTLGETMPCDITARAGAGIHKNQMHAERVDGYNPLAVIDAVKRKKELLLQKQGPALLDIITYRTSGHSASDSCSYRTEEEIKAWEKEDSIASFGKQLTENGVASENQLKEIQEEAEAVAETVCALAADDGVSPRIFIGRGSTAIEDLLYADTKRCCQKSVPKRFLLTKKIRAAKNLPKRKERQARMTVKPIF